MAERIALKIDDRYLKRGPERHRSSTLNRVESELQIFDIVPIDNGRVALVCLDPGDQYVGKYLSHYLDVGQYNTNLRWNTSLGEREEWVLHEIDGKIAFEAVGEHAGKFFGNGMKLREGPPGSDCLWEKAPPANTQGPAKTY